MDNNCGGDYVAIFCVGGRNATSQEFNYTDFMQQVQTGQVEEVNDIRSRNPRYF